MSTLHKNICRRYSLESPHQGDSNEAILMSTHNICFYGEINETILTSTHNICFYGAMCKIYSWIIIKYPPYLFWDSTNDLTCWFLEISLFSSSLTLTFTKDLVNREKLE